MVAPVRDFGNKFFFFNKYAFSTNLDLPTVSSSTNTGMDILPRNIPDNYDKVRGRTSSPKPQSSRASSMSSTKSLVAYHKRMEYNNGLNKDVNMDDDSPQLSYETPQEQAICASMVASPNNNMRKKHVIIKHPTLGSPYVDDPVINIQLPYDPNAPMEPELWDRNFHPILLHGSIEYLELDSKNIKDFLNFIVKYITNKQVDSAKSNNLEDFNGIGEVI